MSGLDLSAAIDMASDETYLEQTVVRYKDSGDDVGVWTLIEAAVTAAAPLLEDQVRERIAAEIKALHPSVRVYELADECDHDPDGPGYDDNHRENADGYVLCYLTHLTDICETCSDTDDECAWPCPTLTALGVTA